MKGNLVKRVGAGVLVFCILAVPALALAQGGLVPCGEVGQDGKIDQCTFQDFILLINKIIDFLIKSIALPASAILFAWAGFLYLTAAGDGTKIKKAHGIFNTVFVGLVLALSGWLVINLVTNVLTNKDLNSFLPS